MNVLLRIASRIASIVTTLTILSAAAIAQNTPSTAPATPSSLDAGQERAAGASALPAVPVQAQTSGQLPQAMTPAAAVGVSQVRIVRLSEVRGQVQLDRNINQQFEPAFANVPIVAGERLQTLDGLAEVEFEDNSSLRLAPNSLVEFATLERAKSGATVSAVKLIRGSLYVSMADSKAPNGLTVGVGQRTVTLPPSSHIRLDVDGSAGKLAVLQGNVILADAGSSLVANKKQNLSFAMASTAAPVVGGHAAEAPYDKWDKAAYDYHKVRASAAFASAAPYSYGLNDLSYYGSFTSMGECGSLWRPYLASAAWNPYQSGVWTMYPGAGYSWVSPYPWGWTPYHSGSWQYCQAGGGWGWQPGGAGGAWNGLDNQALLRVVHGPGHPIHLPAPVLPEPPRRGEPSLVPVNLKALPVSKVDSGQSFVFRSDSAGFGVPRGVFGGLNKISEHVAQRGSATTQVSDAQAQRGMIAVTRSAAGNAGNTPGTPSGSPMGAYGAAHNSGGVAARSSTGSSPAMGGGMGSGGAHGSSAGGSSAASGGGHH